MKTKLFSQLLALVLGVSLLSAGPAAASESRGESLLFNLAFENSTDIFMFPNLLPKYEGVYFHLPRTGAIDDFTSAWGGIILGTGDDAALAVFVRRALGSPMDANRLFAIDNAVTFPSLGGQVSGQFFDVMYGARTWGLGGRIHIWSEASIEANGAPNTYTASAFTMELNSGFQIADGANLGANIILQQIMDTSTMMAFRVSARYIEPTSSPFHTVLAGKFELGVFLPDGGDASFGVGIPFKGGLLYQVIPDTLDVSLLGGIDIHLVSPGGGTDLRFGMVVPSVEIAAEWTPLYWLQVRTAIIGGWGVQFAGDPAENTPKYEQMGFSSGLGFLLGNFTLDAVIRYGLWTDGPYFIGGQAGLFGGVSLTYNWGEGASRNERVQSVHKRADDASGELREVETSRPIKAAKPTPVEEAPAAKPAETKPASSGYEGWGD